MKEDHVFLFRAGGGRSDREEEKGKGKVENKNALL